MSQVTESKSRVLTVINYTYENKPIELTLDLAERIGEFKIVKLIKWATLYNVPLTITAKRVTLTLTQE